MEIVGLKNFIPDDINNLIAKFVGVKPHPLAEILEKEIGRRLRNARTSEYTATNALHFILVIKKSNVIHHVWKTYDRLKHLKSDKARREEFVKLQRWLKHELINNNFYLSRLFKDTKINRFFNM